MTETQLLFAGLVITFLTSFGMIVWWSATIGRDVKNILNVLVEIKEQSKAMNEKLDNHEHRITILEAKA